MFEMISNIIDEFGINFSRFINSGESIIGEDIQYIKKKLKEYDTKNLFDKILSSEPLKYDKALNLAPFDIINSIESKRFFCKSAYEPFSPFKDKYKNYEELHKITGEYITSTKRKNSKALIVLHGFFERSFEWTKLFVFPKLVNDYGYDIYAVELPHHMERQIQSSPFSGAFFFSGDPVITIEAFRQSVSELTQLSLLLDGVYDNINVVGVNLGGHIAMFSTIIDDSFDNYMLIQTGANFNEYIRNITDSSAYFEQNSHINSIDNEFDFVNLYRALNFTKYKPIIDSRKITIIAGKYDRIIPFWSVKKLEQIFYNAKTIYYDGGNFSINFIYNILLEQALSNNIKRRN